MMRVTYPYRGLFLFFLFLACSPPAFSSDARLSVGTAEKEIQIQGFTRGKTFVTVSSEVSGKVIRVNYEIGQIIGKKPLIEIDSTFINFKIKATRLSLKKIETAIKKAESNVAYLQKEFNRIETLHKGDRATEVKRDEAAERLRQGELELSSIRTEKRVLNTNLRELLEQKRRHSVTVPEGWTLVGKHVEAGEVIASGVPVAKVGDFRKLVVPLAVSGAELAAIRNQPIPLSALVNGQPVKAEINWINPVFNEATRKLSMELILREYTGEKRGGLKFNLPLTVKTEGLLVPKSAVVSRYENPRVTLSETGEVVNIIVLGENNGNFVIAADPRLPPGTLLKPGKEK